MATGVGMQSTQVVEDAIAGLRSRTNLSRALAIGSEGCWLALAGAAVVVIVLRVGVRMDIGPLWGLVAAAPVFVGYVAWRGRRGWTSAVGLTALLDARLRAGGALMTNALPEGQGGVIARAIDGMEPRLRRGLPIPQVLIAGAALLACGLVPIPPAADANALRHAATEAALDDLRSEVDLLEEADAADDAEIETLREMLDATERGLEEADAGAGWESIDFAESSVSRAINESAESLADLAAEASAMSSLFESLAGADRESAGALAAGAMQAIAEALRESSLPADLRQQLEQAAESLAQQGENGLSDEQLRDLLEQAAVAAGQCQSGAAGRLATLQNARLMQAGDLAYRLSLHKSASQQLQAYLAQCLASGQFSNGQLAAMLAMAGGKGGVNRGPGHTKLAFGAEAGLAGSAFEPTRLDAGELDLSQSVTAGMGIVSADAAEEGDGSAGGVLDATRARAALDAELVTLPVHRDTVRRYFERRDPKETGEEDDR